MPTIDARSLYSFVYDIVLLDYTNSFYSTVVVKEILADTLV